MDVAHRLIQKWTVHCETGLIIEKKGSQPKTYPENGKKVAIINFSKGIIQIVIL